jgi:hypothetical protein
MHLFLSLPPRLPLFLCKALYFTILSIYLYKYLYLPPVCLPLQWLQFCLSIYVSLPASTTIPPVCLPLRSTLQFCLSIFICISFYLYLPISVCLPLQSTLLYNFVYLLLYESLPISTSPYLSVFLYKAFYCTILSIYLYVSFPISVQFCLSIYICISTSPPVCLAPPPPSFEYCKLMTLIQEITI